MKKASVITSALVVALLVPVVAGASSPSANDRSHAQQICRGLLKQSGRQAFDSIFGTSHNGRNAFGKCVSHNASTIARQDVQAHQNASKQCTAEQQADPAAFASKYGTPPQYKNAFGKCVSQHAKANRDQFLAQDQQQVNAARQCHQQQRQDPAAFKAQWGTNHNKSNAFGKCVSATTKTLNEQQGTS